MISPKSVALLQLGCLLVQVQGIPAPDQAVQRLLQVPPGRSQDVLFGSPPLNQGNRDPFSPGHRDPFDIKVDSVGEGLEPLPYRGGNGASIEGPRNKPKEQQNPDLIRPPSTDHGSMANMRWSFADSHVRIEVSVEISIGRAFLMMCRKEDGPDRRQFVNCPPVKNLQVSICAWITAPTESCTGILKVNGKNWCLSKLKKTTELIFLGHTFWREKSA